MKATVWLQGFGECPAIEVQDIKPGTITVWNYGVKCEAAGIETSASGKTHRIRYADGRLDHRAMRTGRLVGVVEA